MSGVAARPLPDWAPDAADVFRRVEDAARAMVEGLAAVAPGRLVSLSVTLPATLAPAGNELGGDTRWLPPDGGTSLHGAGAAARYLGDDVRAFDREREGWCVLGDGTPPVAFFTVPPATEAPTATLWVPRVLVRHDPSRLTITLSARRGTEDASSWPRQWSGELREVLEPASPPAAAGPVGIVDLAASPAPEVWRARVTAARSAIAAGRLDKVVLARRLDARLAGPVDEAGLMRRLARLYPGCHVLALPHGAGRVVAATPERLVRKRGDELVSHALAGTAARRGEPVEDARAAAALLGSAKERQEHDLVVSAIVAAMAGMCTRVAHDPAPSVLELRHVQHLWTRVRGRLRDELGLLDAVARLHPTPAVLGAPGAAARRWLAAQGERRDSLYSGVAGWLDQRGDGDAMVVLRSVYLEADRAVLWAGAGIVAGSEPAAELAETDLKLRTMLEVLDGAR